MFYNHLKVALRSLFRQKFYSLINILGLAVGLTICILIIVFVKDEWSFDQHYTKADRIYRALMIWGNQEDDPAPFPINPYRLQPALKLDFPELEHVVRFANYGALLTFENTDFVERRTFLVDPEIFEVFDYQIVSGDATTALLDPFSVMLSEHTAQKIFGSEDPLGKVLHYNTDYELKVTGIFKELNANSHLSADVFISMETGKQTFNQLILNNWGEGSCYTYLLLPEEVNKETIEERFPAFIEKNIGEGRSADLGVALQKMTDIHLHSNLRGEIQPNSDVRYIYISLAIALFIILIACINYMNLVTARSVKRAMEIGVRKTLGAPRASLARQFLTESVVVAFLALAVSVGLAAIAIRPFSAFVNKDLNINPFLHPDAFALTIGITLVVGLLAGFYPAFYLSSLPTIRVFRKSSKSGSGGMLRSALVVFQFAISITLMIATMVMFKQWTFMKQTDLGINAENLVMIPIPDQSKYQVLKAQLIDEPAVISVGASNKRLSDRLSSNLGFKAEQFDPDPQIGNSIKVVTSDHDFLRTLQVEFSEGRDFSRDFGSDDTSAFVLNQAAVDMIGWDAPMGKWFETSEFSNGSWVTRRGKVIGVIENYHHESLHNAIEPAVYYVSKGWINWMTIRLSGSNLKATMESIKEKWTQFAPAELYDYQFKATMESIKEKWTQFAPAELYDYQFMDDRINQMYRAEERFFKIFTFFSIIAIIIANLGILGLSAFLAQQRTKEIGVRKVFGASVANLVFLLTREFSTLVWIGFGIAAPISYWLLDDWLENFIFRVEIGWLPFIAGGVLAMILAWGTSGFQSLKAAIANPIESLRHE